MRGNLRSKITPRYLTTFFHEISVLRTEIPSEFLSSEEDCVRFGVVEFNFPLSGVVGELFA